MPRRQIYNPSQIALFPKIYREPRPCKPIPVNLDSVLSAEFRRAGFGLEAEVWPGYGHEVSLTHSLLRERASHNDAFIEYRDYLMQGAELVLTGNTLVFLPTGLGKTYLPMADICQLLSKNFRAKVLFLATTRVLVNQHCELARRLFTEKIKITQLTGRTPVKKRPGLWQENQLIFATPHTIVAEMKKRAIRLTEVDLVIFDEAHLVTGNYPYVPLVKYFLAFQKRIIALTAVPPAGKISAVEKFREQLGVASNHVLARCYNSPDIQPYLFSRQLFRVPISYNHNLLVDEMRQELLLLLQEIYGKFRQSGYARELRREIEEIFIFRHGRLIQVIHGKLVRLEATIDHLINTNSADSHAYALKLYWALAEKTANALARLNNNGVFELQCFLERQTQESLTAAKPKNSTLHFTAHPRILKIKKLIGNYGKTESSESDDSLSQRIILGDSKVQKILELVRQHQQQKILIFTNLRDSLRKIQLALEMAAPVRNLPIFILTGQSAKLNGQGMSSEEQEAVRRKFQSLRQGVLIATQIAEAGLNLSVDMAIFHEPILAVRSYVNRLGRVARDRDGQVYILTYPGEEKQFFVIQSLERNLQRIVEFYQERQANNN